MSEKLNAVQVLQKEFDKKLNSTKFPNENLHKDFFIFLKTALQTLSVAEINCEMETYQKIIANYNLMVNGEDLEWDLLLISFVFNAFSKISPSSLNLKVNEYLKFLQEIEEMPKAWNEIVNKLKLEIAKKLKQAEAQKNSPANMKVVPTLQNKKIKKR
jgi:hypothetical protein